MGWFSSLFSGSNGTLSSDMNKTGASADFSTGMGEKNLTSSSKFFNDILSGDSSKQSQALAPEIGAAKTSAAQTNKTNAEFGTRSGGTAASAAATNDKVHSDITGMVGNLTGTAANSLASSGSSLISQGMQGYKQQADMSQEQLTNWSDSIFGKGITTAASALETYALGGGGGGG